MSCDGLLFKFLSGVLPRLKTPYLASICTGLFASLLACIFKLDELVDMVNFFSRYATNIMQNGSIVTLGIMDLFLTYWLMLFG